VVCSSGHDWRWYADFEDLYGAKCREFVCHTCGMHKLQELPFRRKLITPKEKTTDNQVLARHWMERGK